MDIEEMERQNLVGKYLKKVSKERHNQYKSNWKFWRNTPSLLRVCRDNNWVKLAVLGSIITYDLYVDFGFLGMCSRIVDFVLRKNEELIDKGLVMLYSTWSSFLIKRT